MRFYNPGDEIYMFGFSRGAYIARFLAEMLDHIGLLSHGNEEMVKFAWKAFSQWQSRPQSKDIEGPGKAAAEQKTQKMYNFMKGFRETFSRPVGTIRFLGLFDTVNSVPRFETAWMQRSKFPYTARSSAKVIRHAVSIDERRAKFRQDLMYQRKPSKKHGGHRQHLEEWFNQFRSNQERIASGLGSSHPHRGRSPAEKSTTNGTAQHANFLRPDDDAQLRLGGGRSTEDARFAPYRPRSQSRRLSVEEGDCASSIASEASSVAGQGLEGQQDIDEVWFAGGHGDVGGGWEALEGRKSASHVPLAWIVREAMKAGLTFDMEKVATMDCFSPPPTCSNPQEGPRQPEIRVQDESAVEQERFASVPAEVPVTDEKGSNTNSAFHELMHKAHTSRIHDSLEYNGGLDAMAVTAWKFMELMPFRRMDLQPDGSWKPIRWPLPRGEVRDVPASVRIHGSVIRRLEQDETYRPGNLIVGGGGRGVKRAPKECGIGDWTCVAERDDPIGEIWMRRDEALLTSGLMSGQTM